MSLSKLHALQGKDLQACTCTYHCSDAGKKRGACELSESQKWTRRAMHKTAMQIRLMHMTAVMSGY